VKIFHSVLFPENNIRREEFEDKTPSNKTPSNKPPNKPPNKVSQKTLNMVKDLQTHTNFHKRCNMLHGFITAVMNSHAHDPTIQSKPSE
jgi:hypothetical protein